MLVPAWNAVSTETIVNCFRKARIPTAAEVDPFKIGSMR